MAVRITTVADNNMPAGTIASKVCALVALAGSMDVDALAMRQVGLPLDIQPAAARVEVGTEAMEQAPHKIANVEIPVRTCPDALATRPAGQELTDVTTFAHHSGSKTCEPNAG